MTKAKKATTKKATRLTQSMLNQAIYLSDGNEKLVSDEHNQFLIWNIPAVITCLWRTAQCEHSCYARKAEVFRPTVLPCRERNLAESKKESFVADMIQWITWELSRPSVKGKTIWFRIHESGDFYSLEYLKKWIAIAKMFPNINFLAYTKAVRLVEVAIDEFPSNFVIRYSVWEDTKPEELEIAKRLGLPIYTAFEEKVLDEKIKLESYTKCECHCKNCKACYTSKIKRLAVAIH